jgi:ubiquinone/menaquinone biosynthesis C-methylase UbiE
MRGSCAWRRGPPDDSGRSRRNNNRVNAQYNIAAPNSLPVRIARYQRRKLFEAFLTLTSVSPQDTILDLGVTSDQSYDHSNYFEAWYRQKDHVTAAGLDDGRFLEDWYPGLRFVRVDGRELPFRDQAFDYVHSSAVLEHVGNRERQCQFLREAWRVSRKGTFVTTPNRWFPVEFHTLVPLLHWLPQRLYRAILAGIGHQFFASEDNLNLLSRNALSRLASGAGIRSARIATVALFGWPTNLILTAQR